MASIPKAEYKTDFDLTKLTENPDNPRVIGRDGEKKLDASLEEYGMLEAIVVNKRDDGTLMVVGGHQRLKRLLANGVTKGLITLIKVDLVAEKKLNLMLNGHHGKWDGEKLEATLRELGEEKVDLGSLGLDGIAAFEQIVSSLQAQSEADDALAQVGNTPSETREVQVDDMQLKHRCPRCHFEFDAPTTSEGSREYGANKNPHRKSAPAAEAPPERRRSRAPRIEDEEEE